MPTSDIPVRAFGQAPEGSPGMRTTARVRSCWELEEYDVIEAHLNHQLRHEGTVEALMPEKELFWLIEAKGQRRIIEFGEFTIYLRDRPRLRPTTHHRPTDVVWDKVQKQANEPGTAHIERSPKAAKVCGRTTLP